MSYIDSPEYQDKLAEDSIRAEEDRYEDENDLPCGPDCTFMHEHIISPSELQQMVDDTYNAQIDGFEAFLQMHEDI